ncbi:MAG: hypothetical protein IMZ61_08280 [Planctomycetes bacterium]|nr:hypothetical protein [Planctomycetota bacterium]
MNSDSSAKKGPVVGTIVPYPATDYIKFGDRQIAFQMYSIETGNAIEKLNQPLQDIRFLNVHIDKREIFDDNIGDLYYGFQPKTLIKKKLESPSVPYPSLIGCYEQLPLSNSLVQEIKNIYDLFFQFIFQLVADRVDVKNSPIQISFNKFNLECSRESSDQKHMYFFNIQLGNRKSWTKLIADIFSDGKNIANDFFVFYWVPPASGLFHESIPAFKEKCEIKDKLWSYSRFVRDYLVAHGKAIEVPLIRTNSVVNGLYKDYIEYDNEFEKLVNFLGRRSPEGTALRDGEFSPDGKISQSLRVVYGQEFCLSLGSAEIAQLYLHDRSDHAAAQNSPWQNIAREVTGGKTTSAAGYHGVLGATDDNLRGYSKSNLNGYLQKTGELFLWNHFLKTISSLISRDFMRSREAAPTFLCIDDHPDKIMHLLEALRIWFPGSSIGYLKSGKWANISRSEKILARENWDLFEWMHIGMRKPKNLEEIDFLLVDLEFEGQSLGFEILRKIRAETREAIRPMVITLSRRDDPESIQRALNSGALFHVTKSHFFSLIPAIYDVWRQICDLRNEEKQRYAQYENWHLLSKLPLRLAIDLQSSWVLGKEYELRNGIGRWGKLAESSSDHEWIRSLPKADLHCHIGSCMSNETLVGTAILVLAEKMAQRGGKLKEVLRDIIEFLIPIAADPWLMGKKSRVFKEHVETTQYKQSFGLKEIKGKSIFEVVSDAFSLKKRFVLPEKALLDPHNMLFEETCRHLVEFPVSPYFRRKILLRQKSVTYEEIMLVLILMLYMRDSAKEDERKNATERIGATAIGIVQPALNKAGFAYYSEKVKDALDKFYKIWADNASGYLEALRDIPEGQNIISFLRSAHFPERCLAEDSGSLLNYLRGCEYGGSQNLQTKAAIYLAIESIVQYALNDNIRYLCLRCAVNGYTKIGILSAEEAIESLLESIDHYSGINCQKGKKIHINVILAANRQKDTSDFEKNAAIALKYRNGLSSENDQKRSRATAFFPSKSKVVSFDLSGLEKGNRPTKFEKQFKKLQAESFPTTIHAGEEDTADSIREAVYVAFTQRIGHGLSLRQDPLLQTLVRERHIAIELCPLSNLLTGGAYKNPKEVMAQYKGEIVNINNENKGKTAFCKRKRINDFLESRPEYYPLRQYLNENLDVTINTDNPFISDSTLSKEFLAAAQLVGGLTKWEILRLIKNSFRAAAIPKDEKRKLMNEIDEEIYELILNAA